MSVRRQLNACAWKCSALVFLGHETKGDGNVNPLQMVGGGQLSPFFCGMCVCVKF